VIIKREVGNLLKLVRLVGISFLSAQIVYAVASLSMPFNEKLLHLGHWIAI